MGTTALRQLLKSLCHDSEWKYAVLWKLRHGSPMILTWEDGYFDYPKPREPLQSISNDIYCNGGTDLLSSPFDASASSGTSGAHQIGLVIADMSHLQYPLGEGVVGEVALTGDHFWLSFNNIFSCEENASLFPVFPEEWLLQFASGIKTILLVPVLPHGVLQLGSFEEVAEEIQIVAYIKGRFDGLHNIRENTSPFTLKREFIAQSTLISGPLEHLNGTSAIAISPVKIENSYYSIPANSVKLHKDKQPDGFKCESKNKIPLPIFTEVSAPSESVSASQLGMVESKLFELSNLMEELQAYSDCNEYNVEWFGESLDGMVNAYPAAYMAEPSGGKDTNDVYHKGRNNFLSFPKGSELHKAFGPPFQSLANEKTWDPSFLVEDSFRSSNFICSKDLSARIEPSLFAREGDVEFRLEAVVGNSYSSSDDTSSNIPHNLKSSERFSRHCFTSSENQFQSSTMVGDDLAPWKWNHLASACNSESGNMDTTSTALNSTMSTIFDQEQQGKGRSHPHPQKSQRMSNVARRGKTGENRRPRPRDRQLIQDRVKELRELVPNGTKCSIDGLLDQTIKHMQYLRSVTEQAEKLRQWVHQEVADRKNCRLSEAKDNSRSGKSWAFEFENELQKCPIVVEDLAYPGHILIEMLCNDRGVFLEIAQVIRSLDLTILKGVMESQSNDTWAHFIVEACKGFHRLDIFWPLMQLLQRKRNSISSKI